MAELKKLSGQHNHFTQSVLACEKLLALQRTKATAPSLISQITQARNELKSKKVKLDDIEQTVKQRYDKVAHEMVSALKNLDKMLGKSAKQDSAAGFIGNHRSDKDTSDKGSDSSSDSW